LGGGKLKISKAFGIYNASIISNFATTCSLLSHRFTDSPNVFKKETWREDKRKELRQVVYDRFHSFAKSFEWNLIIDEISELRKSLTKKNSLIDLNPFVEKETAVQIIPTIHGTSDKKAWKICSTGFAALQSLDSGYYGKGIYFTTCALYALPYYSGFEKPTILISWVIPGNIYPVVESHKDDSCSLLGHALRAGYNSHYVCVDKKGNVIRTADDESYDELVIEQESQICPAFVLHLAKDSVEENAREWARVLPSQENVLTTLENK